MKHNPVKKLILLSMLTALSAVLGSFLKIPTPTGFLTLLDAGIFFTAFYFGKKEGALVGALSAFLVDLISGYPQWMLYSLLIHGAQGCFAGFKAPYRYLGLLLATVSMVGGYALASVFMFGVGAALPDLLPNFLQNAFGLAVGLLLYRLFPKQL
ncbi:Substrate-specific component PdxU2 of putative pyridoxin-related ECF transporter [Streptococcus sp. DD11]|uniref:ECF transporter S component n=1 Tax=Streptococcus sp. DD11 TaxID=1777879 RepID=UPI000796FA47|nr:ECF transporter S component [Streptococcus sp. DD11]KXT83643.1 Substrate-specific component PdxU2 of putative pyridoxin-related ECF transporter [Streptococcus sp. DD11]